jgi:hypothetical protein
MRAAAPPGTDMTPETRYQVEGFEVLYISCCFQKSTAWLITRPGMRRASRPRAILNLIACCASLLLGEAVLWPQPKEASNGTATIQLSRSFSIRDVSREDTSTVASAIARYEVITPKQA